MELVCWVFTWSAHYRGNFHAWSREWNRLCLCQLPIPVKPMSKFDTLKQYTFIISHINALAGWFLWLWLGSLGAHLWSGIGCDMALLILAGRGPLLGCSWGLAGQLVPWDLLHTVSSSAAVPSFSLSSDGSGERMEVHEAPWSQGSKLTQPDFCQKQVTKLAQIKLEIQAPSLVERSFQVTLQGAWRAKEGEKWGHFSNQSIGFPGRSLACTVSLYFSPFLFPPSTSSQNFCSLNFLVAMVMELNQLSVPASVCWNSQSSATSWWVRLWSTWALPRVLLCLIFSFVSGVAEVKIWCYFFL